MNFSKKIGIFPEISISPLKGLHFLRGALGDSFPLRWALGACPVRTLPLIKWREAYWCYFLVLVFVLLLLKNFLSTHLELSTAF